MFDPREVRRIYDRRAAGFNRFVETASLGSDRGMRAAYGRALGAGPADVVLDVGCGTGLDFEHVPGTVVGVDLSRGMLDRAARGPRVRLVQADAARLPFRAASFDGVLSTYVVSTVGRWREAFDEMARVTRPGRAIVLTDDRLPAGWFLGPAAMLGALARFGWRSCEAPLWRRLRRACDRCRRGSRLFGLLFWMSGTRRA